METNSHALDIVVTALCRHSAATREEIDVDKPLASVPGIESVKALRAITDVEDECGVVIPDDYLFEQATIAEFSKFVDDLVKVS